MARSQRPGRHVRQQGRRRFAHRLPHRRRAFVERHFVVDTAEVETGVLVEVLFVRQAVAVDHESVEVPKRQIGRRYADAPQVDVLG